jgi:hypothetical protein
MGWQPTPKTGELPPWRRVGGAGANPARVAGEGGSGGVLEHEVAVGAGLRRRRREGLTRIGISMVTALCRWGLIDGGSVPWSGAADSTSGEHRGAGGMLGEVPAGSDGDRRRRLREGPRWRMVGLRPLHAVQRLDSRMSSDQGSVMRCGQAAASDAVASCQGALEKWSKRGGTQGGRRAARVGGSSGFCDGVAMHKEEVRCGTG